MFWTEIVVRTVKTRGAIRKRRIRFPAGLLLRCDVCGSAVCSRSQVPQPGASIHRTPLYMCAASVPPASHQVSPCIDLGTWLLMEQLQECTMHPLSWQDLVKICLHICSITYSAFLCAILFVELNGEEICSNPVVERVVGLIAGAVTNKGRVRCIQCGVCCDSNSCGRFFFPVSYLLIHLTYYIK